ncbi:AAA family ATPase [Sphingomonas sp. S2-65]|uniref:AAA family ATPase n=1 Tax=Sphingomonas sp. S2-65 TaxID=2903960 RepID=UPI001F332789|nr:AAA family ATPase [Sphingomonas sp. S2-65]UYY59721.1 AAA family ATPase [Sphingomonas sp. S2-65]
MTATAAIAPTLSRTPLDEANADPKELRQAADDLARRHAAASVASPHAFIEGLAALALRVDQQAELNRQRASLKRRGESGRVRAVRDEGAEDVLFDLARVAARLLERGRVAEASVLANRYFDVAPQGAAGWAVLPLFLSLHAGAVGNPVLAETLLTPAPARLIVIGGLSGTGKSTLSQRLASRAGRIPGARIIRSDVFRKRLAGALPETRLPPAHYTQRNDRNTYEAMFESAYDHLACGSAVILDAVFMNRSEREVAHALAVRARVPFVGIWLEAPEQNRIERVAGRSDDASDATVQVVRDQSRHSVGELSTWHRIRANRPMELIVAAARGAIDRSAAHA